MSKKYISEFERERDKKVKRFVIVCGALMLMAMWLAINEHNDKIATENAKREKTNARTRNFAKYIINEAYTDATYAARSEDISYEYELAKHDVKQLAKWTADLQADSAKYADAIVRDASMIHEIDKRAGKAVDFATAMKIVRDMPTDSYRPKYERVYAEQSDGDMECVGMRPVTGTKVYQGASQSRILTINQRELKQVCKQLIMNRRALAKTR